MRKEKRTRFWGIFDDPWRKLAAILLAVGLWYYLDAQVTRTVDIDLQVVFNKPEDNVNRIYVTMSSLKYSGAAIQDGDRRANLKGGMVTLSCQGPRHLIEQIEKDPIFRVQELATNVITQGDVNFITFRLENLQHPRPELNKLLTRMSPSTVRIVLDKNAEKTIPLAFTNIELYGIADDLRDRIDRQKTRFEPSTLKIFGPEEKLQGISRATPIFRGTFTAADIRDQSQLVIQLEEKNDEALSWLKVEKAPTATLEIKPDWVEYTLPNVTVVLDPFQVGEDELDNYEIEPKSVQVKIKAGVDLNNLLWTNHEQGVVKREWILKHARVRVFLTESDRNKETFELRPAVELFTVAEFGEGIDRWFVIDVDFKHDDKVPITIKKRKKS